MAAPKTKRVKVKINQVVLRLSNPMMVKIADLIRWSGFDIKKTAIVEKAINELHASVLRDMAKKRHAR